MKSWLVTLTDGSTWLLDIDYLEEGPPPTEGDFEARDWPSQLRAGPEIVAKIRAEAIIYYQELSSK